MLSPLQLLEQVIRPVLAESLGIPDPKSIWITCTLEGDLVANERFDRIDIFWHLNFRLREMGFRVQLDEREFDFSGKTVSDLLAFVRQGLGDSIIQTPVLSVVA